ncbi:hypothetical protein HSX37_11800|uniref:DUF4367 domain-containing protein n=1 Tax=Dendrosporobacter quercicolus TaxID=146817 RepID=A0A1G9SH35_9FIRM|nr:hypothetical protein [Dendrosporobacter quercicolus]NSL48718.1 hypothetical protein [Dendrosporobacter quercicolus DSM 1736]SDM34749.1 hypothetical protein SAMN04488502_10412 [Dendrosporobacter quercicolus]
MCKDNEVNQAEILSELLDDLNGGRQPEVADKEVGELLEMAVLVKRSQDPIPRLLVSQMADKLATELGGPKQKQHRRFICGGLASTAAAVCLAVFIQLSPQAADPQVARQPESSQQARVAGDFGQAVNKSGNETLPQPQSGQNREVPVPRPIEEKAGRSAAPPPEHGIRPEQPADKPLQSILANRTASVDSITGKAGREMTVMMTLPGQEAPQVTIDETAGMIRQVYHYGSKDEVMIIQRRLERESFKKLNDLSPYSETPVPGDETAVQPLAADRVNSITVQVDQYEIIITGPKTPEQLEKMAASLVAAEIPY